MRRWRARTARIVPWSLLGTCVAFAALCLVSGWRGELLGYAGRTHFVGVSISGGACFVGIQSYPDQPSGGFQWAPARPALSPSGKWWFGILRGKQFAIAVPLWPVLIAVSVPTILVWRNHFRASNN